MIVKELLTLPPWVYFEGINFEFQLFNNGGNEIRFCYDISDVEVGSIHKAQYEDSCTWRNKLLYGDDDRSVSWLYLQEGIESDADLIWAIRQCWLWLQERGLLGKDTPYG